MEIINKDIYKINTELIPAVNNFLNIPSRALQGLHVVLETEDTTPLGNELWQNLGAFISTQSRIGWGNPASIRSMLNRKNKDWRYIIWISTKICNASKIDFVWTYAHECQHLLQDIKTPGWHEAERIFENRMKTKIKRYPKEYEKPCEVDAELKAFDAAEHIFGWEKVEKFILTKISNNDNRKEQYKHILRCRKKEITSTKFNLECEYNKKLKRLGRKNNFFSSGC